MSAEASASLAWAEMMRLGLGALRLPPDVFWAMTPVELRLALEGAGLLAPGAGRAWMDSKSLDRLMTAFPDKIEKGT